MKWSYVRSFVIALVTTLAVWLESRFSVVTSGYGTLAIGIVFFVVILVVEWVRDKMDPDIRGTLADIINSCARDAVEITTIQQFLVDTQEEALVMGDEIHILTNSLEGYDVTPPAIKVIADNLSDGVKYIYYLPRDFWPNISHEKDNLVRRIQYSSKNLSNEALDEHIVFHVVDQDLLYNFAIVRRSSQTTGYWYFTTPDRTNGDVSRLVIMTLRRDLRDRLLRVFSGLQKAKKVKATVQGLR